MSKSSGIEVILLLGGVSGYLFYQSIKIHKRLRKIQDTPRSKASSASQGFSELQGFAWPFQSTIFSARQTEAVYYKFRLQREETRGSGKNRRRVWVTVGETSLTDPFLLVDPTGLTLIQPSGADILPSISETRSWNSLNPKEKEHVCQNLLKKSVDSMPSGGFLGFLGPKYRIQEEIIPRGSPLYLSGVFKTENSEVKTLQSPGLTHFHQMLFDPESRSLKNLTHLIDKNKDGKISETEALQSYTFAATMAVKKAGIEKSETEKSFDIHGCVQNNPDHPLYLAGAHEEHLIRKLKYKPVLSLLGSAACASLALFLAFPQALSLSRKPAQQAVMEETTALHQLCVHSQLSACLKLIEIKDLAQIPPENLRYYRQKACSLGDSKSCR